MTIQHSFKSSYGQCACGWCGYGSPFNRDGCKVSKEMREALAAYAIANGRTWRRKLSEAWAAGVDVGPELQQVRNVLGPARLFKIPSWLIEREKRNLAAKEVRNV